jgi:hypothetical protein
MLYIFSKNLIKVEKKTNLYLSTTNTSDADFITCRLRDTAVRPPDL